MEQCREQIVRKARVQLSEQLAGVGYGGRGHWGRTEPA